MSGNDRERLKNLVRDTLISQGVYPKIKAQLRASVFQALQSDDTQRNQTKPEITVLDELIFAYLKERKHLPYSCAVFAAESNLENATYSTDVETLSHRFDVNPGTILLSLLKESALLDEEDLTGTTKVIKRTSNVKPSSQSPRNLQTQSETDNTEESTDQGAAKSESVDKATTGTTDTSNHNNNESSERNYEFSEPDSEYNDSTFSDDFMNKSQTSDKSLELDFNEDEFDIGNESLENSENYSDVTAHEELAEMEGIDHMINFRI